METGSVERQSGRFPSAKRFSLLFFFLSYFSVLNLNLILGVLDAFPGERGNDLTGVKFTSRYLAGANPEMTSPPSVAF